MISLEKLKILTPLQKLLKNVRDLGKLIVAKGFIKLPKVQKSPDLVTLLASDCMSQVETKSKRKKGWRGICTAQNLDLWQQIALSKSTKS